MKTNTFSCYIFHSYIFLITLLVNSLNVLAVEYSKTHTKLTEYVYFTCFAIPTFSNAHVFFFKATTQIWPLIGKNSIEIRGTTLQLLQQTLHLLLLPAQNPLIFLSFLLSLQKLILFLHE